VLQDAMYESAMDWSGPAHSYMVSGWNAFCSDKTNVTTCAPTHNGAEDHHDATVSKNYDCDDFDATTPPPSGTITCSQYLTPDFPWGDMTWLLHKNGISWNYYKQQQTPEYWNPLADFQTVHANEQLGNIQDTSNFYTAAKAGTLPAVSWIGPNPPVSDHPPHLVSDAQNYVTGLINAVMQGPNGASTAVFVTWDDWGGFYDHQAPPVIDSSGPGLRVPGFLVSPFAKVGYIDHQMLTFDSYNKFIEDVFLGGQRIDPATDGWWDPRPNIRENLVGDLSQEFNFVAAHPRPGGKASSRPPGAQPAHLVAAGLGSQPRGRRHLRAS
jgi:phospholipase C